MWIVVLLLLVACDKGREDPLPAPPVPVPAPIPVDARALSCDEARPAHDELLKAQQMAYQDELLLRGLAPAVLEEVWLAGQGDAPTGVPPKPQQIDELVEITRKHKGTSRRMVVTYPFDRANDSYVEMPALVTDNKGGVWQVRKSINPSATKTIVVDACQWGCFGVQPRGDQSPPEHGRQAWLLGQGQTFKGELVIEISAPQVIFQPTRSDCPPPA